jgi:GH35 family endo-1,4-beta-xylanase
MSRDKVSRLINDFRAKRRLAAVGLQVRFAYKLRETGFTQETFRAFNMHGLEARITVRGERLGPRH